MSPAARATDAGRSPLASSRLDRAIERYFPAWGASRLRHRVELEVARRSYEGAANTRRTSGSWNQLSGSAVTDVGWALERLRARSRHLCANSEWATSGVGANVERTIGAGVRPTAEDSAPTVRARIGDLWRRLMVDSFSIDPEGRSNVYSLQAQAFRAAQASGECLIVRRVVRPSAEHPLPLMLVLLEGDQLDVSRNDGTFVDVLERRRETVVIQGVEYDREGRRSGYWILPEHPGQAGGYGYDHPRLGRFQDRQIVGGRGSLQSFRIDARDVIHVGRVDRPGQVRYIPWLAPCLVHLHDLDELMDARLVREKVAACFAAFIYQDPSNPYAGNPLGATLQNPSADPAGPPEDLTRLKPGLLAHLRQGERIDIAQPPEVSGWEEIARTELRAIAVALGCTYSELSGDYSQASYSSHRAAQVDRMRTIVGWRRDIVLPLLCSRLWAWFCEAAVLGGLATRGCRASWTFPRREMIDPEKEIRGLVAEVRAGFRTWGDAVAANGLDPDEVLQQLAREADRMDELDLHLTTDPRAEGFQQGETDPARPRADPQGAAED